MATKQLSNLTAVTTHADADLILTQQNVDGIARKGTWTSTKAFLKTYFDTLYGALANTPIAGEKAALPGTSGTPSGTNKYVTNADSRNTDSRTPTSHGASLHDTTVAPFASRASAVRTTNQSILNATWTQTTYTAEEYDNAAEFATDQFTVGTAGGYLITAGLTFDANATGIREAQIYKNGATMSPQVKMLINASSGDSNSLAISREVALAANDTIRLYCYQDSTAPINVTNAFLTVSRRW